MASILPNAVTHFDDNNGNPLAGGQVFFYIPNTSTLKNTYQDKAQTILNTNPVILDSRGEAIIWGTGTYRQVVKDSDGNLIWDRVTEDPNAGLTGNMTDNLFVSGTDFTPGVTAQLTLTAGPGSIQNTWVFFDGTYQADDQIQSLNGTTLTFTSPIPVGVQKVTVKIGSTIAVGTPSNGTVVDATVANNAAIQSTKLAYRRNATGAKTRTIYSKLSDIICVFDFGAVGDGVTDDTAAIQACYDAVPTGGTMYIPTAPGLSYLISQQGANGYCLNFSRVVNIIADGFFSSLKPAVGTTVNTILLKPDPANAYWGMTWHGLSIGNPINGTRDGNNGIFIDTQVAGSQLPGAMFTRMNIQKGTVGGSYGVLHINSTPNNVNGGMYSTTFCDSIIHNGINLQSSGDSIHIERNLISSDGIGVNASLVSGASELTIIGNNITTNGGQIVIASGSRFHIVDNNMEQQVATSGSTVMVNISGASGTIVNGEIRGNHMGAFTGSNMTANILLGANVQGVTIDGNTMLNTNVGFTGPAIFDQGTQTRIEFNQYGTNLTTRVSPTGPGCMGAAKTLSLQNGWVGYSGSTPTVVKDAMGTVRIVGIIASGTVTANTVLFTLPDSNFYPSQLLRFAVPSNNGSNAIHGEIQIDTSGNVTIQAGGSPYLGITVSFPSANAGVIVSDL